MIPREVGRRFAEVEDGEGAWSRRGAAGPDFDGAFGVEAVALIAEGVLIDGDDFAVGEDGDDLGGHGGEVVAGQERRGEHGPEGHVGAVFVEGELAVADLEHVGVVPVAGGGVLGEAGLAEADPGHAVVAGVDVVGGAPEVGADRRAPLPYGVAAVLAEAVDDGAAGA